MEVKAQAKVAVGIKRLWNALTKGLRSVVPKAAPNLVSHVEVIEGDGGLGTVFLFNFCSGVSTMRYQKEKIVELDESQHQITLEVLEGGHLNIGFSSYKTTFQLIADEEEKTQINIKVSYESEMEENTSPSKTTASALAFISFLESYLLSGAA
ncbi:phytohormone-binding protein-like [Humulus lupulus]|uniref:phytohormone-binding protein-like n=1 Tax=Humulus lupulus TaxID=3486 RepID=UPI002B413E59|nr:phytohormone-binding protein-like [Humulus lupulus]